MSDKPHLKLVRCWRSDGAVTALKKAPGFVSIRKGPLKGCYRGPGLSDKRKQNVFRLGKGCVLEFRPCIRITP